MHQRDTWYARLQKQHGGEWEDTCGRAAYCEQRIGQWEEMARSADFQFRQVNSAMPVVWLPLLMSA